METSTLKNIDKNYINILKSNNSKYYSLDNLV